MQYSMLGFSGARVGVISGKDLAAINNLLKVLDPESPRTVSIHHIRGMTGRGSNIFVCQEEGAIIGMATLCVTECLGRRKGIVEDVAVLLEFQRKGIGWGLMETLIAHARKLGVDVIELTSRPSRVAANTIYQKMGFELRQTNCYRLKLQERVRIADVA